MRKKYSELNSHTELEQQVASDLDKVLKKRGGHVEHHGTASSVAPSTAPSDITVEWTSGRKKYRYLVEVAQRSNESEFTSIVEHLNNSVNKSPDKEATVLYSGRSTSARMIRFIRNENQRRKDNNISGRILFVRLNDLQEILAYWKTFPRNTYPISGLEVLPNKWDSFASDIAAYQIIQSEVFPEWTEKSQELSTELSMSIAVHQERLRKDIMRLENKLRERGYTGQRSHKVLIFLFFAALFEDKRGKDSRLTIEGFKRYKKSIPTGDLVNPEYQDCTVHHLITKEIAVDQEISSSGMMNHYEKIGLPDDFIITEVLPIFESYSMSNSGMDFIGAVFEALARRGEKDNRIGQFFTPETAVIAACKMVKPRPIDTVADPACGTARFLIRAMGMMLQRACERTDMPLDEAENSIKKRQLLGVDIDPWIATIAKMNMYIHGDGKTNIVTANGLALSTYNAFAPLRNSTLLDSLDIVVTNPPLGDINFYEAATDLARKGLLGEIKSSPGTKEYSVDIKNLATNWTKQRMYVVPHKCNEKEMEKKYRIKLNEWQDKLVAAKIAKDKKAENKALRMVDETQAKLDDVLGRIGAGQLTYTPSGNLAKGGALFLNAILDYLKKVRDPNAQEEWKGGSVGLIIDEAVLNTPDYETARTFIITNFFIKAVISLPRNAFEFLAKTTAKTSILVLNRKPDTAVVQREPIFYASPKRIGYTSTGVDPQNELILINKDFDEWESVVKQSYKNNMFAEGILTKLSARLSGFQERFWIFSLDKNNPAERLDFGYKKMGYLVSKMKNTIKLKDVVEPVVRIPEEKEIYKIATITRNDGRVRFKGEEDLEYSARDLRVIRKGDILISGMDAVNGSIGAVQKDCDKLVVSKEYFTLRRRGQNVPEYIAYLLRSKMIREIIEGTVTGTSNRTRIQSINDFLELPIPTPASIPKQKQIAAKIKKAFKSQDRTSISLKRIEDEIFK